MKHQLKFDTRLLAVATLVLSSAGALAAGDVSSGGGMVNEVYGRDAAPSTAATGRSVHVTERPAVSDVSGRGNHISTATSHRVDASATGVGQFGRGSAPMAATKGKQVQGETLAQTR